MQIPKIDKIVVRRLRRLQGQPKALDAVIVKDLTAITGQHRRHHQGPKSVANFKLREGMKVGAKVTLRGEKMWEFLDSLFNIALPRVRDFRGISGKRLRRPRQLCLGLKEQLIFPEIEYDKIDKIRGMDIVITTTANTDEEAASCSAGGRSVRPDKEEKE
jgi:large subunit ribosomal protein L5